jgi:putative endonuclease
MTSLRVTLQGHKANGHSREGGNPERFPTAIRFQETAAGREKQYFVYILASKRNGTLYICITSDLIKRIYEHRNNLVNGFTKKYNVHTLVYYETTGDVHSAILRERQLKKWRRSWKMALIEKNNPQWRDLYDELLQL